MKQAKSIGSLVGNNSSNHQPVPSNLRSAPRQDAPHASSTLGRNATASDFSGPTSPICRCRVMYLGSAVPHITKDGLQGIQEPLRELYPDRDALMSGNAGIDSWLSVWSNGILIENVDETGKEVKRFFKIDALHYCAAVKYVHAAGYNGQLANVPKFLPLDSPLARQTNENPPIFASILRRTTGIKVLECHAFICKREAAANALVRCCFHAYADTMYAKQIGADLSKISTDMNNNNLSNSRLGDQASNLAVAAKKSKSIGNLNDVNGQSGWSRDEPDYAASHRDLMRRKSINDQANNCDNHEETNEHNLRKQQRLSKSLYQLNQNGSASINHQAMTDYDRFMLSQTAGGFIPPPPTHPNQPFYNPVASRIPTYPPPSMIESANNGGTLRSIKSMAANSIASTLLRSKKHAKAMSMAQINQDKIISFHQPHSNAATMVNPILMPPVPQAFMLNANGRPIMSGSQTMKLPSRSAQMQGLNPMAMNFEAMTPKEMKKLLKKSAKYGKDFGKFTDNGLPMMPPPLLPPPPPIHLAHSQDSATMMSQSMYSDIYNPDMQDAHSIHGSTMTRAGPAMLEPFDHMQLKPILYKPSPEFIKSKAGKKWLKQQKEFKKLLPPHLDGLPIVFGPPPVEALEPAPISSGGIQAPPAFIPPPPIPMMDSSGYYNPHPFYAQNGRASTSSTLLRHSPQSQMLHDNAMLQYNGAIPPEPCYMGQRGHGMIYGNPGSMLGPPSSHGPPPTRGYLLDEQSSICQTNGIRASSKRNHMTEQSIISLGDENDYDDEDVDDDEVEVEEQPSVHYMNADKKEASHYSNGRPAKNGHQQMTIQQANVRQQASSSDNFVEGGYHDRDDYEQAMQSTDDQSSYSSGIYKREHINERAFSYSIRQEHKSGGLTSNGSANEHPTRKDMIASGGESCNGQTSGKQLLKQHQRAIYQNSRPHANDHLAGGVPNYPSSAFRDNGEASVTVNELTARLESQLNMKSFANSQIKPNM